MKHAAPDSPAPVEAILHFAGLSCRCGALTGWRGLPASRKVPVFRPDMTPQDLVSMIESLYRIKAGATVFETTSVKPATFLGAPGVQFDYNYVGGDEVKRRGRSVFAVIDGELYLMSLDGAAVHYFDAALPEFESMTTSAART